MRQLYILRHGIAVPHGTPGVEEDQRPLTPKGVKRIKEVGRALAMLGLELDLIVTSPLPRARRTAQIVAQELNLVDRLETSAVLSADSDCQAIRDWLAGLGAERVMIVGHNPSLGELVGLLLLGEPGKLPFDLKKGAVAALSATPRTGSLYQLDWTAPPAMLRLLRKRK